MIHQTLVQAIFSTAVVASSWPLAEPGLAHKPIGTQPVNSEVTSIEKHWNFEIAHYRMQHHNGLQTLNITVDCTSDKANLAPSLLSIYSEISHFLRNYPNEDDYWEIINRELSETLLQDYPELSSVSIMIEVLPTERLPYTRASMINQSRNHMPVEGWRFTATAPVQVQGSHLNYEVEYLYRDGITNSEYPDFIPINDRIVQLLVVAVAKGSVWESTNQDIAERMLQKYPALDAFTSQIEQSGQLELRVNRTEQ